MSKCLGCGTTQGVKQRGDRTTGFGPRGMYYRKAPLWCGRCWTDMTDTVKADEAANERSRMEEIEAVRAQLKGM